MSCCKPYNPCVSNNGSYASTAGQYATAAATSAANAAASATQASTAEANAKEYAIEAAQSAAISGIYLGAKSTAPTLDNQGNPLEVGMQYFNTVDNTMYVWDGTSWISASAFNETTPFLATGTTTNRDLQDRFADVVNVKDFGAVGDGVADDTVAIQTWWNYILSKLDLNETQNNPIPVAGYVPTGTYKSTSGITLEANKYRVQIFGDGYNSRFENVEFFSTRPWFMLKDIALSGTTGVSYGVKLGKDISTGGVSEGAYLIGVYIRDRSIGIHVAHGSRHIVENCNIHRCGLGIKIAGAPEGQDFSNVEVNRCTAGGVLINNGGETKFDCVRVLSNAGFGIKIQRDDSTLEYGGGIGGIPIESYFVNTTSAQNGGVVPAGMAVAGTITSITSYSGGTQIEVTTSSIHELTRGLGPIKLTGTGVSGYDDVSAYVVDVIASNKVVLDLPYISNAATGNINSEGWDLLIESAVVNPDVIDNRNFYFVGGNINNTKIAGAYNFSFYGTRLRSRVYLDKNAAGQYNSQIEFFRNGIGVYASGSSTASSDERNKEIPISGPAADLGWVEICAGRKGNSGWGAGTETMSIRTPLAGAGLLPDRTPAEFAEVFVGPQGSEVSAGRKIYLSDDQATSYTLPFNRLSNIISITTISNGEPLLSASGTVRLDCGSTPETTKDSGGSLLEVSTGPLSGLTGNDGVVTVSASSNGLVYIQNRTGGGKTFYIKHLN